MALIRRILLWYVLLGALPAHAAPSPVQDGKADPVTGNTPETYLERGLEAEAEGDYERALTIWLEAKGRLQAPSPAIGIHYLRLVTEQGLSDYHEAAWGMYAWGLTARQVSPYREILEREVESLRPLAEEDRYRRWKLLLERENAGLFRELRRWWDHLDPTPFTSYNERVIEHRQRLAHALRTYPATTDSTRPDDRGKAWLRYGAPDRTYKGRLWVRPSDVCQVLRMRLTIQGNFVDCQSGQVRRLRDYILEITSNPRYEIWIYDTRERFDTRYNHLQMFGDRADSDGFGRVESVEDLIPRRAYQVSGRYIYQDVTPGLIIQWLYYEQLAGIDAHFTDLFSSLDFRFMRREEPGNQRHLAMQMSLENQEKARRQNERMPGQFSTHLRNLPHIDVEVHQYRLLDEAGRPVFATFMNSRPQQAFLEDFASNQEALLPASLSGLRVSPDRGEIDRALRSYSLHHGVELRGPDGKRLGGERMQPVLILDGENIETASGSAFTIPWAGEGAGQVFYAELHNRHPDTDPRYRSPFPDYLRGMGILLRSQPEPLQPDTASLQMGELILGYRMREEADSSSILPFVAAHDREIPEGEIPAVHFEIYHLQADGQGISDFTVDYEILPVNFLGWTRENQDDIGLTLFFEHDRRRFTENLEIEASGLDPGRYVLRLQVTDRNSGRQAYREVHFEVTKSPGDS